jgi:cytochrome c556
MNVRIRTIGLASALVIAATPATLSAAGGDGPYGELVHDRHENFEEIGDAFKVFRDQLRGDAPEDFAALDTAADVVVGYAPQIPDWFPAGSGPQDGYDTDALANIWDDWNTFASRAADLPPRAEALKAAVGTGEMSQVLDAFRATGGACKACHDDFRAE